MSLIKCHLLYLLNKLFIYIFIFITILNIIYNIVLIKNLGSDMTSLLESKVYYNSAYEIFRLEILVLTLIICAFSFISNNDQYRSLLLTFGISREKYFISKLLTIFSVLLIIFLIEAFIIIVIGIFNNILFFDSFINNILEIIASIFYFGLLSILIIQVSDNFYTIIITFVLLLLTSMNSSNSYLKYFLIILDENSNICLPVLYYFLFDIVLFFINLIIFKKRDLQI